MDTCSKFSNRYFKKGHLSAAFFAVFLMAEGKMKSESGKYDFEKDHM